MIVLLGLCALQVSSLQQVGTGPTAPALLSSVSMFVLDLLDVIVLIEDCILHIANLMKMKTLNDFFHNDGSHDGSDNDDK